MLKERVQAYADIGENCSRIILRAAAEEYDISLSEDILSACGAVSSGFGIGGICSGLVAAIMVLGLLFEEEEVKCRRILFLITAQERLGSLDCCKLSASGETCDSVLMDIAEILQEVIEKDV